MATDPRPTPKQLRYLRSLALQRGETFAVPATKAEASREIRRLRSRKRSSKAELYHDRNEVSKGLSSSPDAARVRDDEITGYGSSATWSKRS